MILLGFSTEQPRDPLASRKDASRVTSGLAALEAGLILVLTFLLSVSCLAATPNGVSVSSGVASLPTAEAGLDWLDPLTGSVVATLDPASPWLPSVGSPSVIQARASTGMGGRPHLQVTDVLPEFWAQPSVWNSFAKGPEGYAGQELERSPNDWAGRPFTDRRATAYDPGLLSRTLSNPTEPLGLHSIRATIINGFLVISWNGRAGWLYTLESTPTLSKAFRPGNQWVAKADGIQSLPLNLAVGSTFFRMIETAP